MKHEPPPVAPPEVSPAADRPTSAGCVGKGRGGAPLGNANAAIHLAYSRKLVRQQRDRHRRAAEAEVSEILKELGLDRSALGRALGRQLRRGETFCRRIESALDRQGVMDRSGQPKAAARALLDRAEGLADTYRRLLEQRAEVVGPPPPLPLLITFRFIGGVTAPAEALDAQDGAGEADAGGDDPGPVPGIPEPVEVRMRRVPDGPGEAIASLAEPEPPAGPTLPGIGPRDKTEFERSRFSSAPRFGSDDRF